MSEPTSLFEPAGGGCWLPTAWAVGPMQPARLSVELLRPVPVAPQQIRAEVSRPGRKVQIVDAGLTTADGTEVASARLLRVHDTPIATPTTHDGSGAPPLAESRLWDEGGPMGRSLQSLLIDDRTPQGANA